METRLAFARGEAARRAKSPVRVFDWSKAVSLIKEHGIKNAGAGLEEDWEWTGGTILNNGQPVPKERTYTYLASNWATPILWDFDTKNSHECWIMKEETDWDSETYWPEEALKQLTTEV